MAVSVVFFVLASLLSIDSAFGCGYQTCPSTYDTHKVQVHLIAHSHQDVGWLETADVYYKDYVSHVFTNTVAELHANSKRTFVVVEIYYFARWWGLQNQQTQDLVRDLVKRGQMTFANGGWSENDEAVTHYNQIIDQMTFGAKFVRNHFGECSEPKVSWQVDPFGASREMANLYAKMGFDGHVVNRGDQTKGGNIKGEFLWNTSVGHSILTTALHHHYSAPDGFDFEGPDEITDNNKHDKARILANLGKQWNKDYGSKGHVLMTFGDDFKFKNAHRYYTNLDKLIEVVNAEHPDVHLFYSSPHCYIKAVRDLAPKLEVRTRDYFPLWTGFYAVRPVVKYLDRFSNNLLQVAKQLEVLGEHPTLRALIFEGENEIGVMQHHDALPGTSRPQVMTDYRQRQLSGINSLKQAISQGLDKLIRKSGQPKPNQPYVYTTVNISDYAAQLDSPAFATIVYNPLVHEQNNIWLRIPVSVQHNYQVFDAVGQEIVVVNAVPITTKVRSMVGHHKDVTHELVFKANLPALGFTTFFVVKQANQLKEEHKAIATNTNQDLVLKGKGFELIVDSKTAIVKQLIQSGKSHRLHQSFQYYISKGSSSSWEFCPAGGPIDLTDHNTVKLVSAVQYNGYAEVTQHVNDWVWQTIRVYEDKEYAEFDWVIGPVEGNYSVGKDIVTRFDTDLHTTGIYYTDANGRQNIQRHKDNQAHACLRTPNAVSYNFYPITTRALLKDPTQSLELTLLSDRSAAAASMHDGSLELMIHRRLFDTGHTDVPVDDHDLDGKGIIARGKVLLFLSDTKQSADQYRPVSQQLFMQPVIAFNPIESVEQYRKDQAVQFTGLKSKVPENVHLLTLESWGNIQQNEVLVRLENFFQPGEESSQTSPAKLSLDVFANVHIEQVAKSNLVVGSRTVTSQLNQTLVPEEIATFVFKVKRDLTKSECGLKWEKLVDHKLPQHSILAGHDVSNESMYVCRHKNVDLIPGKYTDKIKCHISYADKEIHFDDNEVEILTSANANYQWVPHHGGDYVPEQAFVAGHRSFGLPIYIGRCYAHGLIVGKIDEYFYYGYGDKEFHDCPNHEILTC